jgi:hypothetical protein
MKNLLLLFMLFTGLFGYSQAPSTATTNPTCASTAVKSLFSNNYTNLPVDIWRTGWSSATFADTTIAGNAVKRYTGLDFVGIETVMNQINISTMTHLNIDYWTPNMTSFGIKLVDFGANGAFGGGDDVEHQVNITPTQGSWQTLKIPLSSFTGLTTKNHLAQIILVGIPSGTSTLFIDNFYFSDSANCTAAPTAPSTATTNPSCASTAVKSLFSNNYTNLPVDIWRTGWSSATFADTTIAGNAVKRYTGLDFVGIETVMNQINISTMTHLNIDYWTPNMTSFGIKLVDFGANGAFGGGDDVEHQVNITPTQGSWQTLKIPLTSFTGLTTKNHLAQIILVGIPSGTSTLFIDNFYFSDSLNCTAAPTAPSTATTNPTCASTAVKSLFSNNYTNLPVDIWRTGWSSATFADTTIAGNAVKRYTGLDFVGIETVMNQINISTMTHLNIDYWTPNMTSFGIKLVDFGANGAFGGGDDVEHQVNITPTQGSWQTLKIPLSSFTGLTTKNHLAQIILVGIPSGTSTLFIDNFYFSDSVNCTAAPTAPTTATTNPTCASTAVKSLFSNNYTNLPVDIWRTGWSSATFADTTIAGNAVKRYTGLDFVGIETVMNQINISTMTHLNIDYWTPNMTSFGIKLVDFGANGAFGGGDDVEHQVNITPTQGSWQTLKIPLTSFTGLTTKNHLAQIILVGIPSGTSTLFIDNFYFSDSVNCTAAPTGIPAAPVPTTPAANVKSIFSNTYTNIAVNEWGPNWDPYSTPILDSSLSGNAAKYINMTAGKTYAGIDFEPAKFDASSYTHFHIDFYMKAPLNTGQVISFKLSNHDGAGETSAIQYEVAGPAVGQWVSVDVPLSSFTVASNNASRNNIAQIVISAARADVNNPVSFFIDNFYLYNTPVASGLTPAPTPTRAAANVISVFSDAYTNIAGVNLNPSWAQATIQSVFPISGNNTMKYKTLNYQGIELGSDQNLTTAGMTHIHIDYLSPQAGTLRMFLISNSTPVVEKSYNLTIPTTGWMSLDIPLTSFAGVDMTKVFQMKFDNGSGALPGFTDSVLIDNIYFYKQTIVVPPVAPSIVGTWKLRPVVGALGVGPTRGDVSWFSSTINDITTRNCQFDDLYVFDSTGKFTNIFQTATWLEAWQGTNPPACGTPVAPHNGSIPATYSYNSITNTLTLKGKGAHIGIAKATNNGDLTTPSSAPDSIRYILSNIMDTTMTVELNFGTGWWKYLLVKTASITLPPPPPPTAELKFPLTFEETSLNFAYIHRGDVTTTIVANPDASTNSSKFVAKTTKNSGSDATAGSYLTFPTALNLSNTACISVKVWSPLAMIKVRVRLENKLDPNKFIIIDQVLQTPNSWQELLFPLPKLDSNYSFDRFAVLFDVDNPGAGTSFYYDDVMLKSRSSIASAVNQSISIYPNPSQKYLNIESDKKIELVRVYNLKGQEVMNLVTNKNNLVVDISSLSKGNYFIKTTTKGQETINKFTKE